MLKKIRIKNFYSIGAEQIFLLGVKPKDVLDDSTFKLPDSTYCNLIAAIIGSNASGKSSFLKIFSFLKTFVVNSHSSSKPDSSLPFRAHKLHESEDSFVEVEFFEGNLEYRYALRFNEYQVLEEKLESKKKRYSTIFHLTRNGLEVSVKVSGFKINKEDEDRVKLRANISFLSAMIDLGYIEDIRFFKKIDSNISFDRYVYHQLQDAFEISERLSRNEALSNEILDFSKKVDLGISGFKFKNILYDENSEKKTFPVLQCVHISDSGQEFLMDLPSESEGTNATYALLCRIIPVLNSGGLLILDEIDHASHPALTKKIISLFESIETNPNHAQIIFSTHQHLLISDRKKTQIFITQKNSSTLETEIYRLDEIEGIRNDENYFQKYLAGTYGGVPEILWN